MAELNEEKAFDYINKTEPQTSGLQQALGAQAARRQKINAVTLGQQPY